MSASAQHKCLEDLAEITAPIGQAIRCSFVSLEPMTGQSTVAGLVMRELTRSRPGRVLGIDTRTTQSMHRVLQEGAPLSEAFERVPAETRTWMRHQHGLAAMAFDGGGYADWIRVVAPIVRHFDVVGTDWGPLPVLQAARAAFTGQVVCVTATYERASAEAAIAFARAIKEQHSATRPLLVLSDLTRTRSTWPRLVAPRISVPLIAVPHDPDLAADREPGPRTVRRLRSAAAALIRDDTVSGRRP